jgi:hypothetical protein
LQIGVGKFRAGAERLNRAVTIELKPHACPSSAAWCARTHKKRQVEARSIRSAVEVQPLRPRIGPVGRVGNGMETVDVAEHLLGCIACPSRVVRRIAPRLNATAFLIPERALEAGNPAGRRHPGRSTAVQKIEIGGVRG